MIKNLPCNAGDMGLTHGRGTRNSHGKGQRGLWTATTLHSRAQEMKLLKPVRPRACALQQGRPLQREAHVLQLEKTYLQQPRPKAAKKILV